MPVTKRGIYHNLKESKYVASNGEVTFYFSSKLYLNNFLKKYEQNRINFLSKMAKIVVDSYLNLEILADITLYCTIETRGFYARMKGVNNPKLSLPINKEDLHKYALRKMMSKEVSGWV